MKSKKELVSGLAVHFYHSSNLMLSKLLLKLFKAQILRKEVVEDWSVNEPTCMKDAVAK